MSSTVLEIVKVKLKAGIDDGSFMEESKKFHENWLSKQPGFQKRLTLKSSEGEWVDILWWDSMEDAKATAEKVMQEPSAAAWFGMMDESTVSMYHGEIVEEYR